MMVREKRLQRDPSNWRSVIQSKTVGDMVNMEYDTEEESVEDTHHITIVNKSNSDSIEVIIISFSSKTIDSYVCMQVGQVWTITT
jgi:hypothetical protein